MTLYLGRTLGSWLTTISFVWTSTWIFESFVHLHGGWRALTELAILVAVLMLVPEEIEFREHLYDCNPEIHVTQHFDGDYCECEIDDEAVCSWHRRRLKGRAR